MASPVAYFLWPTASLMLEGVKLETLFIDAGGVLVFPNWQRICDTLARHGVIATPDVLAAAELLAKRDLDLGRTVLRTSDRGWDYFDCVLAEAGIAQTDRTDAALAELHRYHDEVNLWEHVPADVVPALTRFRELGLQLVVVSNANGKLHVLFERIGLAPLVDLALDSAIEGVEKPDPRLFQIALARAGASAETTLHVGDFYNVDIVGARAAGLVEAVLLDPAGLYEGFDCPRVRSLGELAEKLEKDSQG
jgi:HAD superfamily hydrolase (TIGR01549 family)